MCYNCCGIYGIALHKEAEEFFGRPLPFPPDYDHLFFRKNSLSCLKKRELNGNLTGCARRRAVKSTISRRAPGAASSPSARGTMTFEWPSTARGRSAGGAGRCEESGRRSTSAPSASWSTTAPRNASWPTGTTTTQESAPPDAMTATIPESATKCT